MPTEPEFRALSERVASTETLVREMHHALLGNGQPGTIKEMQDDIESLQFKSKYVTGMVAGVGAIFGTGVPWGVRYVLAKLFGVHFS